MLQLVLVLIRAEDLSHGVVIVCIMHCPRSHHCPLFEILSQRQGLSSNQRASSNNIVDVFRVSLSGACHVTLAVLHDALRALVDMLLVAMLIEDVSLVMSTLAYVDSETITRADGAQSSRVPVPLHDDPYVAVRQAQLVDIDTESEPEEAPSEA
ncbi:hypothetical protein Tco_1013070 [Tanacetum coccineum]